MSIVPYLAAAGPDDAVDTDCPDVYLTSAYGRAAACAEPGDWHVASCPGRTMLPYIVRRVDETTRDAISPYGYPGIFVYPGCPPADLARFWDQTIGTWRDAAVVSVFLRFSPLDPACVDAVRALPGLVLTETGETIRVDVSAGPAQVWAGLEGRARTAVRKAHDAGLGGLIRPATPRDLIPGSPFRRLYEQTMARVGAAPGYLFSDDYYRRLTEGLGERLLIAQVRQPDAAVCATALVLRHQTRVHYHLAGSDPPAARNGANNLLVWTILAYAAQDGCHVVHLGGGVRPDDGLFRFKRSFGGIRSAYWTGKVIVDPHRYGELLRERAGALGRTVAEIRDSSFFPAYRAR